MKKMILLIPAMLAVSALSAETIPLSEWNLPETSKKTNTAIEAVFGGEKYGTLFWGPFRRLAAEFQRVSDKVSDVLYLANRVVMGKDNSLALLLQLSYFVVDVHLENFSTKMIDFLFRQ